MAPGPPVMTPRLLTVILLPVCNGIFINALLIVAPEESQNILQTAVDTYGKLDILMQVASILRDRKDGHV